MKSYETSSSTSHTSTWWADPEAFRYVKGASPLKQRRWQGPLNSLQLHPWHQRSSYDLQREEDKEQKKLREGRDRLQAALRDFRVEAEVLKVRRGGRLDLYEVLPGRGVKARQLTRLASDLARTLGSPGLRILEQLPGSAALGIEVARAPEDWHFCPLDPHLSAVDRPSSNLAFLLGEQPWGGRLWGSLEEIPHLLVTGTTGSGKSQFLKSMLSCWLQQTTSAELQWILMDFKWIELAPFQHAPQLLTPLVTEVREATLIFDWLLEEMERRFQQWSQSEVGVRAPLPRLVVVIDEFADLILTTTQIAQAVIRIAQKGRAAGIHLILSTQRPSKEVVTGLLKANFLHRVAFKVESSIDARVVLGQSGAEHLLGQGDLIYRDGSGTHHRLHAPMLSSDALQKTLAHAQAMASALEEPQHFKEHRAALHQRRVVGNLVNHAKPRSSQSAEPLLAQILRFILERQSISITELQRVFQIGYNRAARLIDHLERHKILHQPAQGKARRLMAPYDVEDFPFGALLKLANSSPSTSDAVNLKLTSQQEEKPSGEAPHAALQITG